MGEKEEKIDKHDSIVSTPLQIFLSKPYNVTFTEKRIDDRLLQHQKMHLAKFIHLYVQETMLVY